MMTHYMAQKIEEPSAQIIQTNKEKLLEAIRYFVTKDNKDDNILPDVSEHGPEYFLFDHTSKPCVTINKDFASIGNRNIRVSPEFIALCVKFLEHRVNPKEEKPIALRKNFVRTISKSAWQSR